VYPTLAPPPSPPPAQSEEMHYSPPPPPKTSVPPVPGPSGDAAGWQPIATRLFTDGQFAVPEDFGSIAVLIFPGGAAQDTDRARQVCRAFVGQFPDAVAVARDYPHWQQMVTLWPVLRGSDALDPGNEDVHGAQADNAVCPAAVKDYNYVEAQRWLAKMPRNVFGNGRGSFLIAWAPAHQAGEPNVEILSYDLSGFETPTALAAAMKIWAREIEGSPDAWARGWDLTRFRLAVSTGADHFGAQIGAAMKLVPWLGDH
jgi:hypothetical protein